MKSPKCNAHAKEIDLLDVAALINVLVDMIGIASDSKGQSTMSRPQLSGVEYLVRPPVIKNFQ